VLTFADPVFHFGPSHYADKAAREYHIVVAPRSTATSSSDTIRT
jgi:hypothetical protein